jgi:hypothetical protein
MNRIKEVMEEKGIKQTWLSERLGKSYSQVNGYVQNRHQPMVVCLGINMLAVIVNTDP